MSTSTTSRSKQTKAAKARKPSSEDISTSYNKFKKFEGKQYTGMQIGRSHKWNYDPDVWKEKK
jgi:hypothetical protein